MAEATGDIGLTVVHPVPEDEVAGWVGTMATTFLENIASDGHRQAVDGIRRTWDPQRRWGARAGDRWVATLSSIERTLTVPGSAGACAEVPADAVTQVTVAGTHRRRGVLTAMLSDSLRAARERGDAVSILWAAEWPIYGRFGYAPASVDVRYSVRPRGHSLAGTGKGSIRQVDAEEMREHAPAVFDAARILRAGNINRPASWWDRILGVNGFANPQADGMQHNRFVHGGSNGPDGFVVWTPGREFDGHGLGAIEVVEVCAADDDAYRDLWSYVLGLDLVSDVTLPRRPVDEPVRWLLADGRVLHQDRASDGIWLRFLDLPAALSARRYGVSDRLVLDVVDDDIGGFANGRYVLDGGPDGAGCRPSTVDTPDLRVHQRALAAAYLGGFSLHGQAVAGRVDELTPGALRRADAMFATPTAPWCATGF